MVQTLARLQYYKCLGLAADVQTSAVPPNFCDVPLGTAQLPELWGHRNTAMCEYEQNVGMFCCTDIRLAGSVIAHEGRLEVEFAGKWGTVCDNSFGKDEAAVACYMLGYGYVLENNIQFILIF